MKKLFSAILILLMLFNVTVISFAAGNSYYVEELELQITVPENYYVITRNTSSSDPVFDKFGVTYDDTIAQFERDNIYLNALPSDGSESIIVNMTKTTVSDLSDFSDSDLKEMKPAFETEYSSMGMTITGFDVYQYSKFKFLKIYFNDSANSFYGLRYYTIYDHKALLFTMKSYSGEISATQESIIRTAVNSIDFDYSEAESNWFVYFDPETQISFTVPENWEKSSFSNEYIDVQFEATDNSQNFIFYGSSDLWEEIPDSEKVGYDREDIDEDFFTEADVAEMFQTSEDKISTVTYNGVKYFKCDIAETYGLDLGSMSESIYLLRIEDGWMFSFQFNGDLDSECYSDFESLISSVKYNSSESSDSSDGYDTEEASSDETVVIIVLILLFVFAVALVFIIKKKNK